MNLTPGLKKVYKNLKTNPLFGTYEDLGNRLGMSRQAAEEAVGKLEERHLVRIIDVPKHQAVFPDIHSLTESR